MIVATLIGAGSTFLRLAPNHIIRNSEVKGASWSRDMSQEAVIHAYRHLYRRSLRAIQFSKPARYTLRDRIRLAFRKGSAADYNAERVDNTLEFLQYAARENGLEHKIVKNLLFVWWVQSDGGHARSRNKNPTREELEIKTTAYDTFNHNIRMLNESMGLCLPATTVRDPN